MTKYGLPQVVVFPVLIIAAMIAVYHQGPRILPVWVIFTAESIFLVVLVWVLAFFRDPPRNIISGPNVILAPADGCVTDVETIDGDSVFEGPAIKIGIFLSIFNVHINRVPCAVKVDKITYKKGRYKNALNPESGRVNESNDILMTMLDAPKDPVLVRQISGAIARRIVCRAQPGQEFSGGRKFGMIKFGSRTELYIPVRQNVKCLVKVGDKVKAGLTVLLRYE